MLQKKKTAKTCLRLLYDMSTTFPVFTVPKYFRAEAEFCGRMWELQYRVCADDERPIVENEPPH